MQLAPTCCSSSNWPAVYTCNNRQNHCTKYGHALVLSKHALYSSHALHVQPGSCTMSNHVLCGNSLHKISLRMHVAANFSTETCNCSRARCVNNLNALHRRACNRSNFQSALVQLHSALATATATTIPLACPGCHNLYVGKTPMLVANLLPCTNKCLSQCQASVLQLMQTNVAVREHCTLPNRSICQRQRARKL